MERPRTRARVERKPVVFVDPGPDFARERLFALLHPSLSANAPLTSLVDSVDLELAWLGKLYPVQTALFYVPYIVDPSPLSTIIRGLFLDLVSTTNWQTQTTQEFQSQVIGQLWQESSRDLPAVTQCIACVLQGNPQLSSELLPMILHETSRNSSHLACLILTQIAPIQGAEAIAEAVLSTNDLFFIHKLVELPVLHYTQNVSSALIAGAMMHSDENLMTAQCIKRFPHQDAQFAQVAMHLLQTKRSMPNCQAAIEYLYEIPQFQLKLVSFLVNNPGLWLDLNCHQCLIQVVLSSNECVDLLGLFLLETTSERMSYAQIMTIGALCHSKWFSPQEGERFAKCLVDTLSICLSTEKEPDKGEMKRHQTVVMWALEQALRQQPVLFFNSGNSFARLATLILSLLREETNNGVLFVLELLLEQELLVSKDNRFSFCFSQLAELLQRQLERTEMEEEDNDGNQICRVLCLLVSVSSGEVEGFVSWILSKQMQRLERKLGNGNKKRRQLNDHQCTQSLQQLASLRVMLACLQRLGNNKALGQDVDTYAQCINIAIRVWKLEEKEEEDQQEEERKVLAMAVLRMACMGNNNHPELFEVVQTELLSNLHATTSFKRIESSLALCFTQSHHPQVFAYVTSLLLRDVQSLPLQPLSLTMAACKACGEMLMNRLVVTELEAWLCVDGIDCKQALDVLLVFAKSFPSTHHDNAHIAWLASKYITHLTLHFHSIRTTDCLGVKCLELICTAAPHSPPAFASKYFEWKQLLDCTANADLILVAMGWIT
ncbi:hypothetical protein BASA81_014035 [Batrachochytrium salamandrivorans]|nr:hypothetical protein BASA81_014035 [Batrachochytrium salamandrivorans]